MTPLPRVIGLAGLKGSGKSTLATEMTARHRYHLVKFAGPLKRMLSSLGLTHHQIEGVDKETPSWMLCGRTPREAMQTLGTEWGRECIGADFWVRCWTESVRALGVDARVVVDDVRFENEVAAIRSFGGEIWRIERPGLTPDGHVSETGILALPVDRVIQNDGSIYELRSRFL